MLGAIGDGTLESHGCHQCRDVIAIDELGVTEHFGMLPEELVNFLVMILDLRDEFLRIFERSERVSIGLAEELNASCRGEILHGVNKLRYINLKLFKCCSANGESYLELVAILAYHVKQHLVCGQIGSLRNACNNLVVGKVIVVVVVVAYIKESVVLQTKRLVYLKIETNCFHCREGIFKNE